ncbi:MAG: hypothetical protein KJZ95_07875 [Caldilinea sp.]|jgi:hypothetical protein|nr:hypothetical protein [Caldilinea sp.]
MTRYVRRTITIIVTETWTLLWEPERAPPHHPDAESTPLENIRLECTTQSISVYSSFSPRKETP